MSEVKVKSVFPGGAVVKTIPANAGDAGDTCLITGSSHWWAAVHGVAEG